MTVTTSLRRVPQVGAPERRPDEWEVPPTKWRRLSRSDTIVAATRAVRSTSVSGAEEGPRSTLAPVESVGAAALVVDALPTALEWYSALLGNLPVLIDRARVVFEVAGTQLTLLNGESSSEQVTRSLTYWFVADVDGAAALWRSCGGAVVEQPTVTGPGARVCQLRDPFGNTFCLAQARR